MWLDAPYGYGKSVLMSQWAEQLEGEGWRVLWLSVQGRDVKTSLASLLDLPAEISWGLLLDTLWQVPTLLVLEDLEGSEDLAPLLRDIRGLLSLASRKALPYAELPRLTTQGRVVHLRARQLAFTLDETLNLFANKEVARLAWERSQGWALPLHFAALTGEAPDNEALLEGVRESLSSDAWEEALFLSALPYLPFEAATEHSRELADKGYTQELESGYRLHSLAAEALRRDYLALIRLRVVQQQHRLPLVLRAEAFARTGLFDDLKALLETSLELAAADPQGLLQWDALCGPERGAGRCLAVAYAQSVLGQLEAARKGYSAVVYHPLATADQKLIALGWWIFDLPLEAEATFQQLMDLARTLFESASAPKVGAFLFNASAFPYTRHSWEIVEQLMLEAISYYQSGDNVDAEIASIQNRLAQVRWELHGDLEQLQVAIQNNLRFQAASPYNAPVNQAALGRLLALISAPEALDHLELAEQGLAHNPATAISAAAEKAALLGKTETFPELVAQFRPWQTIDPGTMDRIIALWARTLRRGGQAEVALEVLGDAEGFYAQAERALTLAALGRPQDALAGLPAAELSRLRYIRLELQTARYLLSGAATDLEQLINLTTARKRILPALLPLQMLPRHRSELSLAYRLEAVLMSGWHEAIACRFAEIPDLELTILGHVTARVLGKLVDLTDRHKALLVLLALGYSRDIIGEALWPETDSKKVSNNLHVQLNLLRKLLEPWGLKTYLTEDGLVRTTSDIHALREALATRNKARVLQLYQEPLAAGVDLPLVDEVRVSVREEVLDFLYETALQEKDAVDCLERLMELDPLHEEGLQLLLRALISKGRKREAHRRYHSFAARLKTEMGLEPLAETRALLT